VIEKNFDIPFIADLALREKQIQQNYRPIIAVHKWFARRPGTLFRGLLLSEFLEKPLHESFYQANSLKGIKVADPFMGGGTPLIEANRLGCEIAGFDINPMAFWIVKQEIEHLDLDAYLRAANSLREQLEKEIPCPACKGRRTGRFFKIPDSQDLVKADQAEERWAKTPASYVPDDEIPTGDETNRLHRWGYGHYREMFNARQLLGLELSAQWITRIANERVRNSLATNLSDLLRYQNMLCRYDTMALKSLDIFSVHGFPVGLVQCESNFLGIVDPKKRICIGSGGWVIQDYKKITLQASAGVTKKDRPLTTAMFTEFETCYGKDPNSLPEPQILASDAITELDACVDELQLILDLIEAEEVE
jgi:adenine-specific DNA methylase